MKLYHFALIFLVIFICICAVLDMKTYILKSLLKEKLWMDDVIDTAVNDGLQHIISADGYEVIDVNKDIMIDRFFLSLYSSFDIISNREKQKVIELYIPACILSVQEGFYCYFYEEINNSIGETEYVRVWSELLPYLYEDEDFVYRFTLSDKLYLYDKNNLLQHSKGIQYYQIDYRDIRTKPEFEIIRNARSSNFLLDDEKYELVKKRAILDTLEGKIAYYTTCHNRIAASNGINYNFSFSHGGLKEWAGYLNDVSMIVVFQGYPYRNHMDTYHNVATAGAYIKARELLFIEERSWYKVYHREGCPHLINNANVRKGVYHSVTECVKQGCYACEQCCYSGAYVPALNFR